MIYSSVKSVQSIASFLHSAIAWSSDAIVLCFAVVALAMTSCSDDSDYDVSRAPFVFDAWIDSDGYPVVIVTRAVTLGDATIDAADMVVRWAKVTISDGERTEIMTGGVDRSVFPPFSYRCFTMRGEVGRAYTITAECAGVRASAQSTILQPAQITGIGFEQMSDSVYSGTLDFKAPDVDDTCRYMVLTRVKGVDSRHYPAFMGMSTTTRAGEQKSVPLFRGKHADLDVYTPNFRKGDTIDVMLARIDPAVYRFWEAYQNEVYFGNNIFISASSMPVGNVVGGYGVFSARGVSRRQAIVGVD